MHCVISTFVSAVARLSLAVLLAIGLPGQARAADAPPPAAGTQADQSGEPDELDEYELQRLLVDTIDQVERSYVKPVSRRQLVEAAIRGVLRELDPYSNYIDPEAMDSFRAGLESQFAGIGVHLGVERRELKIVSPMVGGPAYRGGVLPGDRLVEIDGVSTRGLLVDEVARRLKGPTGTKVTIAVIHPGETEKTYLTLTRVVVEIDTVLGVGRRSDDSWQFVLDAERKIGYVRLAAFSRHTARDLSEAMDELRQQGFRALILDLRNNPGGLLSSAVEVADLFLGEGRIVSIRGRARGDETYDAKQTGTLGQFPMAVLVNRYSASGSEIVAACLQDHGRAIIVGERTWGKGSVQNVMEMEGGQSALKLTTALYVRPSGKNIHRFADATDEDEWGVMPDAGHQRRLTDAEMAELAAGRRRSETARGLEAAQSGPAPSIDLDPQLLLAKQCVEETLAAGSAVRSEPRPACPSSAP